MTLAPDPLCRPSTLVAVATEVRPEDEAPARDGVMEADQGHAAVLGDLRDLIAALDRRPTREDSVRERAIARDAATLRSQAEARVVSLGQATPAGPRCER